MKHLSWILVCIGMIILSIIAFSPMVIPVGQSEPSLGPLPYTLWTGISTVILMIILTYIGTRVHPVNHEEESL